MGQAKLQLADTTRWWLADPVAPHLRKDKPGATVETLSLTREFIGETHRGLERAEAHPLGNQHQRDTISLWVAEGVNEIQQTVEQVPLLPLGPSPMYSITAQQPTLPRPEETPKAPPLSLIHI